MEIQRWGLIDYVEALALQQENVGHVQAGGADQLIFCGHPDVVTRGRGTVAGDVDDGCTYPQVEVNRGGRATYHGPQQLVIYPIFNLNRGRSPNEAPAAAVEFLRQCEAVTVEVLKHFLPAARVGTRPGETGVWVGIDPEHLNLKIASIGIAVRRGITSHGIALNCESSETAFQGLRPCGYDRHVMTSLERELGHSVPREILIEHFAQSFRRRFASKPARTEFVSEQI